MGKKKRVKQGKIEGRTVKLFWSDKKTLTAKVSDNAETVQWSSGTWTPLRKQRWSYSEGEPVKTHKVTIGGTDLHLVTFAKNGQHPEPIVKGQVITIGNQNISLENGQLILKTFALPN